MVFHLKGRLIMSIILCWIDKPWFYELEVVQVENCDALLKLPEITLTFFLSGLCGWSGSCARTPSRRASTPSRRTSSNSRGTSAPAARRWERAYKFKSNFEKCSKMSLPKDSQANEASASRAWYQHCHKWPYLGGHPEHPFTAMLISQSRGTCLNLFMCLPTKSSSDILEYYRVILVVSD